MAAAVTVRPVESRADRKAFVDLAWQVYRNDPAWVPPLKDEVHALITPGRNPWFGHAKAKLWIAWREGRPVAPLSSAARPIVGSRWMFSRHDLSNASGGTLRRRTCPSS